MSRMILQKAKEIAGIAGVTILAALALPASALEAPMPSSVERASFAAFYRAHFPGAALAEPIFIVEQSGTAQGRRLLAQVDTRARRAPRGLCRMDRRRFVFGSQWTIGQPARLAWVDHARCSAPPQHQVQILQNMPDTDVIALLAHAPTVLARARLLFAGNTSCAVQRASRFRLHAITVGAPVAGGEEMAELVFRSERNSSATVWVRRSGLAYDPWNVSCADA